MARKEQKCLYWITQDISGTYIKPEHEPGMRNNCIAVLNTVTTKSQKWLKPKPEFYEVLPHCNICTYDADYNLKVSVKAYIN